MYLQDCFFIRILDVSQSDGVFDCRMDYAGWVSASSPTYD